MINDLTFHLIFRLQYQLKLFCTQFYVVVHRLNLHDYSIASYATAQEFDAIQVTSIFGHFDPQHPRWVYIGIGDQHSKDITHLKVLSPTSQNCHQHHCHPHFWLHFNIEFKKKLLYSSSVV